MKLKKENIFPIYNSEDCDRAIFLLEQVSDIDREDQECEDVFNIIKTLVANWDSYQPQLPRASASDILRTLMDSENVTQEKLAATTGILQPNISRCLSGRYKMSAKNAEKFAEFFNVDPELFLGNNKSNINRNSNDEKPTYLVNEIETNNFSVSLISRNESTPFSIQTNNVINFSDKKRRA